MFSVHAGLYDKLGVSYLLELFHNSWLEYMYIRTIGISADFTRVSSGLTHRHSPVSGYKAVSINSGAEEYTRQCKT